MSNGHVKVAHGGTTFNLQLSSSDGNKYAIQETRAIPEELRRIYMQAGCSEVFEGVFMFIQNDFSGGDMQPVFERQDMFAESNLAEVRPQGSVSYSPFLHHSPHGLGAVVASPTPAVMFHRVLGDALYMLNSYGELYINGACVNVDGRGLSDPHVGEIYNVGSDVYAIMLKHGSWAKVYLGTLDTANEWEPPATDLGWTKSVAQVKYTEPFVYVAYRDGSVGIFNERLLGSPLVVKLSTLSQGMMQIEEVKSTDAVTDPQSMTQLANKNLIFGQASSPDNALPQFIKIQSHADSMPESIGDAIFVKISLDSDPSNSDQSGFTSSSRAIPETMISALGLGSSIGEGKCINRFHKRKQMAFNGTPNDSLILLDGQYEESDDPNGEGIFNEADDWIDGFHFMAMPLSLTATITFTYHNASGDTFSLDPIKYRFHLGEGIDLGMLEGTKYLRPGTIIVKIRDFLLKDEKINRGDTWYAWLVKEGMALASGIKLPADTVPGTVMVNTLIPLSAMAYQTMAPGHRRPIMNYPVVETARPESGQTWQYSHRDRTLRFLLPPTGRMAWVTSGSLSLSYRRVGSTILPSLLPNELDGCTAVFNDPMNDAWMNEWKITGNTENHLYVKDFESLPDHPTPATITATVLQREDDIVMDRAMLGMPVSSSVVRGMFAVGTSDGTVGRFYLVDRATVTLLDERVGAVPIAAGASLNDSILLAWQDDGFVEIVVPGSGTVHRRASIANVGVFVRRDNDVAFVCMDYCAAIAEGTTWTEYSFDETHGTIAGYHAGLLVNGLLDAKVYRDMQIATTKKVRLLTSRYRFAKDGGIKKLLKSINVETEGLVGSAEATLVFNGVNNGPVSLPYAAVTDQLFQDLQLGLNMTADVLKSIVIVFSICPCYIKPVWTMRISCNAHLRDVLEQEFKFLYYDDDPTAEPGYNNLAGRMGRAVTFTDLEGHEHQCTILRFEVIGQPSINSDSTNTDLRRDNSYIIEMKIAENYNVP